MQPEKLKLDNLMKVGLTLEAGASEDSFDLLAEPEKIEFIYGIATCGITPFEKLLYQKGAGDELCFTVQLKNFREFFGPLTPELPDRLQHRDRTFIRVTIGSVQRPSDSEVIKALAASAGGCGGDCGCGCG